MRLCLDIEANGLVNPTKVLVVVCKDIDDGTLHIFREPSDDAKVAENLRRLLGVATLLVFHNGLEYDLPVLRNLLHVRVDSRNCLDTLIISRLVAYSRSAGHSIEAYGLEFGYPKIQFSNFSKYSEEMETYCIRDVDICHLIYKKYLKSINDPSMQQAIRLEHDFQEIVNQLHNTGFYFDATRASRLLSKVTSELGLLDSEILTAFPPREELIREFTPRATKYGTISKTSVPRSLHDKIAEYEVGKTYRHTRMVPFNPASHKQLIDVLHEAGWRPIDRTDTHKDTERTINILKRDRNPANQVDLTTALAKLDTLKKYGWKINENNLSSLPDGSECRIKLQKDEENILENIIKSTQIKSVQPHSPITIKISNVTGVTASSAVMELLQKILRRCLPTKVDVVEFAKNQKNLWSIIVTDQAKFVDFSASYVTDILDGTKDTTNTQQIILDGLKKHFYTAPKPAKLLAKRILLESRRRTLTEWLGLVESDSRIHGKFVGLGAWTHRMAHQNPNTANIPGEFQLDGSKKLYGKEMRSLWCAPKGKLLVGVDAEGIQLRIFAHYIDDPEFTDSLVRGRKEDKSDPHSLNQRIMGSVCKSRAAAKRFIYALLLGAGIGKLAEILEVDRGRAEEALSNLLERYQGFAKLKREVLPVDGKRGYFIGLDGRKVPIPGETPSSRTHLAMSGYLQNGEALVTKWAALDWNRKLTKEKVDYKFVNFVHDEFIAECPNDMKIALHIAKTMSESIKLAGEHFKVKCPLAGSYYNDDHKDFTIGQSWYETH